MAGDAGGVRFNFPDLFRREFAQTLQSVRIAALPEIFQPGQFVFVRGDDDFAALLMRNAVVAAKRDHLLQAADAQLRLFRAGFVVKAGMQHAAVVSGLVRGELGLLFEQQQPGLRPCLQKAMGRGQADNAAAHDDDIAIHGSTGSEWMARRPDFAGCNFEFTGLDMRAGCRKQCRDESRKQAASRIFLTKKSRPCNLSQ